MRDREPQRPVERGARDFAALRDPGAKKTVEFERRDDDRGMRRGGDDREFRRGGDDREFRRGGDDREFRRGGDDREIRRGGDDREMRRGGDDREMRRGGDDREIRRGPPAAAREGESNWRSMRPSTDRPQDSRDQRDVRPVRGAEREERPPRDERDKLPAGRLSAADREREQERERKRKYHFTGTSLIISLVSRILSRNEEHFLLSKLRIYYSQELQLVMIFWFELPKI